MSRLLHPPTHSRKRSVRRRAQKSVAENYHLGDADLLVMVLASAGFLLRLTTLLTAALPVATHQQLTFLDGIARLLMLPGGLLALLILLVGRQFHQGHQMQRAGFCGAGLQLLGACLPLLGCTTPSPGGSVHATCNLTLAWPLLALGLVATVLQLRAHRMNQLLLIGAGSRFRRLH
ncbi:hypothetical protein Pan44_46250 [Caulifigura coniformis]|uniref:Uncharacterized protein n=1 Tax=Caulifigura coniformis TaxID=2527983 RepID=A0A517SKB9_9PLAN|nr:hypothetical protein [Caulifigura coniformis]QDT56569.1 hypothetical protein Pan44_46250 [Caulifigura coniformis]